MSRGRQKKILLLLEPVLAHQRRVLIGISDYAAEHPGWRFCSWNELGRVPTVEAVSGWDVDGAIVRVQNTRFPEQAAEAGVPCVIVGTGSGGVGSSRVEPDQAMIGRLAAEHLMECGLVSFAFYGVSGYRASSGRLDGFRAALGEHGYVPKVLLGGGRTRRAGFEARRRWIRSLPTPVGLMAFNDLRAWDMISSCRDAGRRVPEDVAIVGVDNDDLVCRVVNPPISSVDTNAERIGYEAAGLLARMMRGRDKQTQVIVEANGVIARKSSDVLALDDAAAAAAVRFVREHVQDRIDVSAVVDHVSLSRRALERRFKAATGRALGEEIRLSRLNRARGLLLDSALALERIAEASGFLDAKQMGAAFRKYLRTSPMKYRRDHVRRTNS